eukprot:TRINITY_DN4678_c0_g1_i5.p1 TRINITY_DN4678_c0_g1~~TRINITY_DN4678_c0_g1_i5.p1  ORF type:complete len:196 (-),score=29.83 TRINITY_DN4678_c0_g1_i5:119-706(-)
MKKGDISNQCLLLFDKMEIRHGYLYLKSTSELIGSIDGPIAAKDVSKHKEQLAEKAGKYIMVFFLVDIQGRIAVQIGYHLSKKADGKLVSKWVKEYTNVLEANGLAVCGGSSDRFSGASTFLKNIQPKLWNHQIEQHPDVLSKVTNEDIHPTDKIDSDSVDHMHTTKESLINLNDLHMSLLGAISKRLHTLERTW